MSEASATPATAPLILGRYRVTEQLGVNRLATVYSAADERLQRRVLLHLLRKELLGQERPHARFLAEAAQMARRSHPALLEIFDSGEAGGRPFVVTEHVAGRPLRGLGLLTVEQAILYLRQITGGVAVCQAACTPELPVGLYHPPISSSNVLVVDEGRVKLVDSWLIPQAELQGDLAHYRAPELSAGQQPGPASAVYALGILLYELITGERPISGPDPRATALAHLNATIPPLRVKRPSLYLPAAEQLVARSTAQAPQDRYPDAQRFGEALDALWRDVSTATRPLAPPRRQAAQPLPAPAPAPTATAPTATAPTMRTAPAPAPRPAPAAVAPARRSGRRGGQPPATPDRFRRQGLARGLIGWAVMTGLIVLVASGAYFGVRALAGNVPSPSLPALPGLPRPEGGIFGWIDSLLGNDRLMVVNIVAGLNLRDRAGLDSNVIGTVPNGTPVRVLEGPTVNPQDNIPWVRVRVELGGQQVEGWLSLNYLRPKE